MFRGWYAKFGSMKFDVLRDDDLVRFTRIQDEGGQETNAIRPITEHKDFEYPNWKFLQTG
jgi:hypothetical protein